MFDRKVSGGLASPRRPYLWYSNHGLANTPRRPNPQEKDQHQENSPSSLPFFILALPINYCRSTTGVSGMFARRVKPVLQIGLLDAGMVLQKNGGIDTKEM